MNDFRNMKFRETIKNTRRIVFKLGTNVLTRSDGNVALSRIYSLIEAITDLKKQGKEIIIVTSGAVGMGMKKLGLGIKPSVNCMKQACAAVGHKELMHIYQDGFDKFSILTAQILLTAEDFSERRRFLSLRDTLNSLLELGVIPIINENDPVSITGLTCYQENDVTVCFGDNDKLSALIMSKLNADFLVILSDIDGLYDSDPRKNKNAKIIPIVSEFTPEIEALGFESSKKGRGGMKTKLEAAKIAVHSGGIAIIANGKKSGIIEQIFNGDEVGTVFLPIGNLSGKKRWIAYSTNISGKIKVNDGAKQALINNNASLLPLGIVQIKNNFSKGDVVSILDIENKEFARGIVNYSSIECQKFIGKHSNEIENILGYKDYDEIILRDNIVIL